MDLATLSKEDLLIVTSMLLEGKTMEDVEKKFVSAQTRTIIDNLHSLLCRRGHGEGGCRYHFDQDFEMPDRKKWFDLAQQLTTEYGSEDNLRKALAFTFKIISQIKVITGYDTSGEAEPIVIDLLHRYTETLVDEFFAIEASRPQDLPYTPSQNPE